MNIEKISKFVLRWISIIFGFVLIGTGLNVVLDSRKKNKKKDSKSKND